jgi:uncharacterized protein (DUF849 family)
MGSVNFGAGALINTPAQIEVMAGSIRQAGAMPELEIFDVGHLALAGRMIRDGLLDDSAIFQFALGVPWGAPANAETLILMRGMLPRTAKWAAFGIGREEFPMVAQAMLLGGHARVGLEDNLYLERGVQASSNAELVHKAGKIAAVLDKDLASPNQAREILGLARA